MTFVADGAQWIWDRISWIIRTAGLQNVETVEVLDCCHAVHPVSLTLAALGLSKEERNPLYRQHRTLLRNGRWRRVVDELSSLQREDDPIDALSTEISYLRRHGEAGQLSYVSFRSRGPPCGSGAIESGIRRVINLRLKSNAMFWTTENAESMLQVRCQVTSDQWGKAIVELAEFEHTVAYDGYQWTPIATSRKNENSHSTAT
ncbi:hypothetical protein [Stieleria varia]|uniref:Uncharacterized protein n=1 Tax=Stieleria varia TaxID=2528005 RepID=A0A5C5ZWK0_9BACT|nr:hypothetical protein [Stieleria varia]TWT91974.1 hypothetical protein Pla52n_64470 [Stieleria varia]